MSGCDSAALAAYWKSPSHLLIESWWVGLLSPTMPSVGSRAFWERIPSSIAASAVIQDNFEQNLITIGTPVAIVRCAQFRILRQTITSPASNPNATVVIASFRWRSAALLALTKLEGWAKGPLTRTSAIMCR